MTNFSTFIESADVALLRLGFGGSFDDAVADYFEGSYPGKLACGCFEKTFDVLPYWWTQHLGPVCGNVTSIFDVKDGYYLFHRGRLLHWHSGVAELTQGEVVAGMIGLLMKSHGYFTGKNANAVVAYLDPIIKNLLRARKADPAPAPKPETPVPPVATVVDDPYQVLGLARDASTAEIDKAVRAKRAAIHPDRVAHLDPVFLKVAEAETKRVQVAYEAIMKDRAKHPSVGRVAPPSEAPSNEGASSKAGARRPRTREAKSGGHSSSIVRGDRGSGGRSPSAVRKSRKT